MAVAPKRHIPFYIRVKNTFTPAGIALACFSLCISVVIGLGQGGLWPSQADAQGGGTSTQPTETTTTGNDDSLSIEKNTVCIASYKSTTQNTDPISLANAIAAAKALNNKEIPAGSTLSMREVLTDVYKNDFQEAPVSAFTISGRALGGGASQVSSALYVAALKAGMNVTERTAHEAVVDFALAGCDADVLREGTDLKIENNLGRDVWIRAVASDHNVEVKIYASSGKVDKVNTPVPVSEVVDCVERNASDLLSDPAAAGLASDASIPSYTVKTYLVTYKDGVEHTRELISKDVYAATADTPVSAGK